MSLGPVTLPMDFERNFTRGNEDRYRAPKLLDSLLKLVGLCSLFL